MTKCTEQLIDRQTETSAVSRHYLALSLKGIKHIPYETKIHDFESRGESCSASLISSIVNKVSSFISSSN